MALLLRLLLPYPREVTLIIIIAIIIIIIIIALISIAPCLIDKGEHTALDKINKNVCINLL